MEISVEELRNLLVEFQSELDPDSYYRAESANRFLLRKGIIKEKCKHEHKIPQLTISGEILPWHFICIDCNEAICTLR